MRPTPEGIEIYRFEPDLHDDYAAIRDTSIDIQELLHSVLVEHYKERLGIPIDTDMFSPNSLEKVLVQRVHLAGSGDMSVVEGEVFWLARDRQAGDKLVGVCKLNRLDGQIVEIEEFDVRGPDPNSQDDRGYRGRGIGSALLTAALHDRDVNPDDYVSLNVIQGNPTRDLYESLGFLPTGEVNNYDVTSYDYDGDQPVLHERMISSVSAVLCRLTLGYDSPRKTFNINESSTDQDGTTPDSSSIGQVAAELRVVQDEHIPSAVSDITDRLSRIEARISRLQADINDQNRQKIEGQIALLNSAQEALKAAAQTLTDHDTGVTKRIRGYIEDVNG
ncbi:MAG TPA: GNAT family N-acetyltransferase [Patescibacteria group bacterium]|nr:GNAT family N-acetyltransferase [Patescibacteria group bacterium]